MRTKGTWIVKANDTIFAAADGNREIFVGQTFTASDAEFICKAANSHDELVVACKEILRVRQVCIDYEKPKDLALRDLDAWRLIENALKLAEGEKK